MSKKILAMMLAVMMLFTSGCSAQLAVDKDGNISVDGVPIEEYADELSDLIGDLNKEDEQSRIEYSYATKEEGIDLLMSNKEYYDGFTQNDLDYKMQKKDAVMDEYLDFAKDQVLDFTEEEKSAIDSIMSEIEDKIRENGYVLPELDPIVFISTTQKEEYGSLAYTHGTQIYFNTKRMLSADIGDQAKVIMAHELFHCLTRSNPDFRKDMYRLIGFTVQDDDFVIPPSAKEFFISNPDVEHHNAYATFTIDGEKVDCFTALVTTKHFEKAGDSFFDCATTALIPIDGRDVYYTLEDASDFYDVFGMNTGYVIDPEECMADNFSYALMYGADGEDGKGYKTPEIIEGILNYLTGESEVAQNIDTSVMKPWINSNIIGLVTDDVNADLKDDFYLNINHDYLRDAKLRPGYSSESPIFDASDIVKERCLKILTDKSLTGRDARMPQDFYELYLDWDARNEVGVEPLMPFVEKLSKVKTLKDMTDFLLSDMNFDYGVMLSRVEISVDANDSTKYCVEIVPASLSLGDSAEYVNMTENGKRMKTVREGQYGYMLGRVGFDENETEQLIRDMFDFESKIAEYQMTSLEKSASDAYKKMVNPVAMDDLRKMSPDYPLVRYMEERGYSESKLINLSEPEWLKGLNSLYKDENLNGIKAYILAHTVGNYINETDEEAHRTYQRLANEYMGITDSKSDEEEAYNQTMSKFSDNISRIYIEQYLNEDIREEIRTLCQDTADTYYEMFDEIDWLSEETREEAKNKLKHLTIHAVYPDKWRDDSMFSVTSKEDGGSYFQAILDYEKANREREMTRINGDVDRDIWELNILDTNAFYNPQDNSINIIPGFFCDATYRSDMSIEEKYGALGSVIGHEISHAFDTNGAQFDADGNLRNWWKDEDFEAFLDRADKLIAYYDGIVAFDDGTPYRGQMVQTEAIADMAGFKCMLKMAEKIEDFDYDKFFRANAYLWARTGTVSYMESVVLTDSHPLNYLRFNVTAAQYDEFYDTYGIKEGDGMYIAPEDRIAVW